MAVAHDAVSESHTGTTGSTSAASFTWTHTPVGTPRGVLIFVVNASAAVDIVSTVTYGGVTVPEPIASAVATDIAGEPGHCSIFFLGSSVPTGAQSVVVNRTNNANVMYAVAVTVTAGADTRVPVGSIVKLEGDGTLTVQSCDDGSPGANSVRYAGGHSGLAAVPSAGTGSTALIGIDFGALVAAVVRETTAGQGARNVGFSSGTTDDRAIIHLAVSELPTGPTATTQAVSSVAEETATANGNITSIGGEAPDTRGFVFGTTTQSDPGNVAPAATAYDDFISENGSFSTGAFTEGLTDLAPNTTYYVRAFARNSGGYDYGDEVNFTTVDWPIRLAASANIAASAATATTARLTAPSGKTTGDFDAGAISDDTNPLPANDLGADLYTELEWCLQATSEATAAEIYQFRVTRSGEVFEAYTVTPEWTIAGGGAALRRYSMTTLGVG